MPREVNCEEQGKRKEEKREEKRKEERRKKIRKKKENKKEKGTPLEHTIHIPDPEQGTWCRKLHSRMYIYCLL